MSEVVPMAWQPRPGSYPARILSYLETHPEGATDSELVIVLGDNVRHQAVNMACNQLQTRGVLHRQRVGPAIRNFVDTTSTPEPAPPSAPQPTQPQVSSALGFTTRPWTWEGNVQAAIVRFLAGEGWAIRRVVDTASREAGKDVEAEREGTSLWVTVKGYPEGTTRTMPYTQARHWFAGAMMDVILWRQESESARIAVGLPKMTTYQNLASRTGWFQRAAGYSYLWVTENDVEQA